MAIVRQNGRIYIYIYVSLHTKLHPYPLLFIICKRVLRVARGDRKLHKLNLNRISTQDFNFTRNTLGKIIILYYIALVGFWT